MTKIQALIFALFFPAAAWSTERILLLDYIGWIEENSDFEYRNQPLPEIVQWSERELHVWMYSEEEVLEIEADETLGFPVFLGIYDPPAKRIIVPERFDPWSFDYAPTLVHELVHYLQDVSGTMDQCPGNSEREAYEISNAWIAEHNHPRKPMDGFTIAMIEMSCNELPHAP